MSRFRRNCMLIQTISQAIIALFFLITMLAILLFWIFAGALVASFFGAVGESVSSPLPAPPVFPDVSVVPPDPDLQAKEQARRALRGALQPNNQRLNNGHPSEGEAQADGLPNGVRRK